VKLAAQPGKETLLQLARERPAAADDAAQGLTIALKVRFIKERLEHGWDKLDGGDLLALD
jgi:hypothetical protein